MAKLTLNDVVGGTIATGINANSTLIEAAIENTLSRDGTLPNEMDADIDMNSYDLNNVGTLAATAVTVGGVAIAGVTSSMPVIKAKSADETKNTDATPAIDTHLYGWTLEAGSTYSIKGVLKVDNSASITPGFSYLFNFSNAPIDSWGMMDEVSARITGFETTDITVEKELGWAVSASAPIMHFELVVVTHATLSSTMDFHWAQRTSSANDTILKAGSYFAVQKTS